MGKKVSVNNIIVQLSELLYLSFWGVMLFAKGIGLYDGQNLYKVFLVLAFLCIVVKLCITEHTYKEWTVILLLLAWSVIVYRVSGEKGILICMVTVVAMKNVSLKRCFQVGLTVWASAMGIRFLSSLIFIGNVETAVQTKNFLGAVLRYFMGYPHPNVLHISYLILTALVIFCVKEIYNWKHLLLLLTGNLFLFFYSYSFTGALIVVIYVCLSFYVRKRTIHKIEYFLVKLVFPGCVLFSVFIPVALRGKAFELADKIFNNRINFAKHFLTIDNISLLGKNLAAITTDVITMDNTYVFALVTYGTPIFLLICAGYMGTMSYYVKEKKNIELAMICCFLVAGLTEPFLFNTSFKNLTLLFLGEWFFMMMKGREGDQKERALFTDKDIEICIPVKELQKAIGGLQDVWSAYKKVILKIGVAVAFVFSIFVGIFYRERPEVLAVQKENLLVFEKIRVIVTAFSLNFIITVMVIVCIVVLKKGFLKACKEP